MREVIGSAQVDPVCWSDMQGVADVLKKQKEVSIINGQWTGNDVPRNLEVAGKEREKD